jgi:hypothetical protein
LFLEWIRQLSAAPTQKWNCELSIHFIHLSIFSCIRCKYRFPSGANVVWNPNLLQWTLADEELFNSHQCWSLFGCNHFCARCMETDFLTDWDLLTNSNQFQRVI